MRNVRRVKRNGIFRIERRDATPKDIVCLYFVFFFSGAVFFILLLFIMIRYSPSSVQYFDNLTGSLRPYMYGSAGLAALTGGFLCVAYLAIMRYIDPFKNDNTPKIPKHKFFQQYESENKHQELPNNKNTPND